MIAEDCFWLFKMKISSAVQNEKTNLKSVLKFEIYSQQFFLWSKCVWNLNFTLAILKNSNQKLDAFISIELLVGICSNQFLRFSPFLDTLIIMKSTELPTEISTKLMGFASWCSSPGKLENSTSFLWPWTWGLVWRCWGWWVSAPIFARLVEKNRAKHLLPQCGDLIREVFLYWIKDYLLWSGF